MSGRSWCFEHDCAMPCQECAKKPPSLGKCFDCKHEFAADAETDLVVKCGCGSRIRVGKDDPRLSRPSA